jgi:hypothetical protein
MPATEDLGFATVFRHELGAIRDRRRNMRLEVLEQAARKGDYSDAAVQRVLAAAREEEGSARSACHRAEWGAELLRTALGANQAAVENRAQQVVDHVRAAARAIRKLAGPPQEPEATTPAAAVAVSALPGPEATVPAAMPRLRELANQKADELEWAAKQAEPSLAGAATAPAGAPHAMPSANGQDAIARAVSLTVDSAWHILQMALVAREPQEADLGESTGKTAEQHVEASKDAAKDATKEYDQAVAKAHTIATGLAAHTAAEFAEKAAATAVVAQAASNSNRDLAAAVTLQSVAAAAREVADSYCKLRQVFPSPGFPDHGLLEAAADAIKALAEGLRTSTRVVSLAAADNPDFAAPQSAELQRAKDSAESAKKYTETLASEPAPDSALAAALTAFQGALEEAVASLDRILEPPAPDPLGQRAFLPGDLASRWKEVVNATDKAAKTCDKMSLAVLGLLDPKAAEEMGQDGWQAARAREVGGAAVGEVVKHAREVTNRAWKAKEEAAAALRLASARLVEEVKGEKEAPGRREVSLHSVRLQALDMDLVGLALSGGGIRSASFALGVLQALARLRLLGFFDYLSTVSGGGYIGSWLAAWVCRERSLANVERQLDPNRVEQAKAKRTVKKQETAPSTQDNPPHPLARAAVDEEPEPINHLRAYSRPATRRAGPPSTTSCIFWGALCSRPCSFGP